MSQRRSSKFLAESKLNQDKLCGSWVAKAPWFRPLGTERWPRALAKAFKAGFCRSIRFTFWGWHGTTDSFGVRVAMLSFFIHPRRYHFIDLSDSQCFVFDFINRRWNDSLTTRSNCSICDNRSTTSRSSFGYNTEYLPDPQTPPTKCPHHPHQLPLGLGQVQSHHCSRRLDRSSPRASASSMPMYLSACGRPLPI